MKDILYFQSSLNAGNNSSLEGVRRFAKSSNWRVHVTPYADAAYHHGDHTASSQEPDVKNLLKFWKPVGVIAECGAAPKLLKPRDFGAVPVVFLDQLPIPGAICVTSDAVAIAELAARELLSLAFKTYAYVPWMEKVYWSEERGREFSRIVRMSGFNFLQLKKIPSGAGTEIYRNWLCTWLRSAPKPLGVFAANDYVASIILSCAEREKIRVPNELAVIGVDDDHEICNHANPPLTSIQLDRERAGYRAAQLLNERMLCPSVEVKGRTFGPICVNHRQSTFAYSRRDARVSIAMKMIRCKACEGLKARDVISKMGCSRRLAELRFREATGHSILDEILSVRIERAKFLLEYSSRPIADIAKSCGYGSADALRRVFVSECGINPLVWRKRADQ